MGLQRRGNSVPQPDWNSRDWSQYFSDQIVTPDDGTVTPDSLAPATITQIEDTASAAATTAAEVAQAAAIAAATTLAANAQAGAVSTSASALSAHEAAPNPHPVYLTQSEADGLYHGPSVTYAEITGKPAVLALLFSGTGSPEGVVTAGVGATYHRTDGGAGSSFYVKESGSGNTGWAAK